MIVIVTLTFTFVFVYQFSDKLKSNLENLAVSECKVFESSIAEYLSAYRMDRIREQILFLKQNPIVEYVYVLDTNGVVLMDGTFSRELRFSIPQDNFNDNLIKSDDIIIQENDSLFDVGMPITFSNRNLGFIRIGNSKLQLNNDIQDFVNTSILISIAFILVTAVLTFFVMRSISKPLRKITDMTKKIAEGKFNQRINVNSRDEVKVLANAFNEMSDKLKSARESLINAKLYAERSNQLKSEFLAQISHEIRTPINSMLSFASLIEEDFASSINDDSKEYFKVIKNSGRRIIRTVDLILNMSEIQKGTYEPKFMHFNVVGEILIQLKNEFAGIAADKNLELSLINNSQNSNIYADEYTITQVFQNLIDNAIKYTDDGHVHIYAEDSADSHLIVRIEDSGIGISEEFIEHLFDPFRQEQQGYSRTYDGAGLGLSLVKNYCELNNAEITVQSVKSKGSTFSVSFKRNL
jgi:signal transduction histidine kinase